MNKTRCDWAGNNPLYVDYHDNEWGYPVKDDDKLFEFLILETFQAGLSWITILKKRENFREAFDQFDFKNIAQYDELKVNELLQNSGIVRNQLKIRAAISNAKAFMEVQREFGSFSSYLWAFVNGELIFSKNGGCTRHIKDKLSKDMKNRGFKFVGSTVIYAHMQACGMVNDHLTDCFRHPSNQ
jgi:DNA-3-methyladenine glycosylase I